MNLEKVVFGFFVLLAATLNFGFFLGDISVPDLHNIYELFGALVVSLIATVLKFGDRTQIGAVHLATSLVASIQLIAATVLHIYFTQATEAGLTPSAISHVVSLSGGALFANVVSVVLLVVELALAAAGRAAPQLQIMLLGFPVKIAVGFCIVGASLYTLPGAIRTILAGI
ncbi:MAG: DUF6394 family protein, partial [Gammaproteobacteria bacterium]